MFYNSHTESRQVIFSILDEFDSISEPAVAFVTFNSTDDPPILDLNGPTLPEMNYSIQYIEGSSPVKVGV